MPAQFTPDLAELGLQRL